MHACCKYYEFKDSDKVLETAVILVSMINEIEKYKSAFDLNTSIQGFDQKFDKIKNTVSKFNDKVTESIDQNNFWEFPQLF